MQNPYGWFCTRRWGGAILVKIFIWVLYIDVENQWFPQDFCSTNRGFSNVFHIYVSLHEGKLQDFLDFVGSSRKKMSASFQASAQRNDISMSISIIFANSKKGWCLVLILIPSRWRKFCDHLTCCVFLMFHVMIRVFLGHILHICNYITFISPIPILS